MTRRMHGEPAEEELEAMIVATNALLDEQDL
jgi:hypothetical protein